jgi:peroxiredoxin
VTKGSKPPPFTLKDQDGKTVSLDKFKGKPLVLYFYPADETPGCTKQVNTLFFQFLPMLHSFPFTVSTPQFQHSIKINAFS